MPIVMSAMQEQSSLNMANVDSQHQGTDSQCGRETSSLLQDWQVGITLTLEKQAKEIELAKERSDVHQAQITRGNRVLIDIKQKFAQSQKDLEEFQLQRAKIVQNNERLEKGLKQLDGTKERFSTELEKCDDWTSKIDRHFALYETQLVQREMQIKSQIAEERRRLEGALEGIDDLKRQLERAKTQQAEKTVRGQGVRLQLQELERQLRAHETVREELQGQYDRHQSDILCKEQELASLQQQVDALSKSDTELQLHLQAMEEKNNNQERFMHHLQSQHDQNKKQFIARQEEVRADIDRLKTRSAMLNNEIASAEQTLQNTDTLFNKSKLDRNEIKDKQLKSSSKLSNLESDARAIELRKESKDDLANEADEVAASINQKQEQINSFNIGNTKLKEELEKAEEQHCHMESSCSSLELKISDLKVDKKRVENSVNELRRKLESLSQGQQANEGNTSNQAVPSTAKKSKKASFQEENKRHSESDQELKELLAKFRQ